MYRKTCCTTSSLDIGSGGGDSVNLHEIFDVMGMVLSSKLPVCGQALLHCRALDKREYLMIIFVIFHRNHLLRSR